MYVPAVSVVMPAFNVEPYIEGSIQSVLNQSFSNFELIVVDDGSSDDTANICDRLAAADPRITIIKHSSNQGMGAARNTGLDRALGTFIYFIDSDDLLVPKALETFHKVAVDSRADFIHCSSFYKRHETEHGIFSEARLYGFDCTAGISRLPGDKNDRLKRFFCMGGTRFMPWLNFFRRDFFVKNNLRFLNVIFGDVAVFAAALALADNVFAIRDSLYVYSKREGSLTSARHIPGAFKPTINISIEAGLRLLDDTFATIQEDILSDKIKAECKHTFVSTLRTYAQII